VLTGVINSWFLIGFSNWLGLFTTLYGVSLLVKLTLFALMLLLAAMNRYWLTPDLQIGLSAQGPTDATIRRIRTNIFAETALGFLVLCAVAFLGTQPPPVSLQ
jgi:putative copper resistance protein D